MKKNYWEEFPFYSVSGSLSETNTETTLPYNIGAISRQGSDHYHNGINNQDAVNIIIEDNLMIGVLCDGCTNNYSTVINDYSYNGAGSILLAHLISNLCRKKILGRKKRLDPNYLLRSLTNEASKSLNIIQNQLKIDSRNKIEVQRNLFLATVVGFIIREKDYLVFNCGDGIVQVNEEVIDLSSDSGKYLSNYSNFKSTQTNGLKMISYGQTKNLNKLLIASDGFNESQVLNNIFFQNFLNSKKNQSSGLIDLIPEFHLDVLNNLYKNPKNRNWPYDDATAILLKNK